MVTWDKTLHGCRIREPIKTRAGWPDPATYFPLFKSFGFNVLRVCSPWIWFGDDTPLATCLATYEAIASAADANGLQVIWDHEPYGQAAWPSSVAPQATDVNTFGQQMTQFWQNTLGGQNVWQEMWQTMWVPIIQQVDHHPSTLTYELWGEPPLYNATTAQMQAFNQYMATQMRTLTSKTITWMAQNSFGNNVSPSDITSVAPTGISNLALDVHYYAPSGMYATIAPWIQAAHSIGVTNVFIGEYGYTGACGGNPSMSQAQAYLTQTFTDIKNLNIPSCYFAWDTSDIAPCPASDWCNILCAPANPYWLCNMVSATQNSILGGGGGNTVLSSLSVDNVVKTGGP